MPNNQFSAMKKSKRHFWHVCYMVCAIIVILIAILFIVYIAYTANKRELWQIAGGIFLCLVWISFSAFEIYKLIKSKHEKETAPPPVTENTETSALREAKTNDAYKILLDAKVGTYQIYYRRRKLVNELVINDAVYAEKKGFFEPVHTLCAVIDGHKIEVGLDDMNCSFIAFDGELVNYKQRIF